jgi:hypothetical protein
MGARENKNKKPMGWALLIVLIFIPFAPYFFCIPPAHFLFLFYKNKNKKGWALLLLCFYSYFTLAFANCKKQEQKE